MIVYGFYVKLCNIYLQINIANLFFCGANWICTQQRWSHGLAWELRMAKSSDLLGSRVGRVSSVSV